jgi:hypothetical protein
MSLSERSDQEVRVSGRDAVAGPSIRPYPVQWCPIGMLLLAHRCRLCLRGSAMDCLSFVGLLRWFSTQNSCQLAASHSHTQGTLTHSRSPHRLTTGVGLLQGALHTTGDSRTSLLRSLLSPRHPSPLVVPSPLLVDFYFLPLIVYPSLALNATSTSACQLTLPSCLHASLCTAAGEPYRVPCLQPA